MMDQQDKNRIQKALNASLSGIQETPCLARRIIAEGKEWRKKKMTKKLLVSLAFALVLMLVSVAYAATQWGILDYLEGMIGTQPPTADQVMQANLYQETINGVEITVKEAGYDGKTFFLLYSYRLVDAKEPMGTLKNGRYWISEKDEALLYEKNVGWWIDHIWINGKAVDMPGNSGGSVLGSDVPGEIVHVEYWRFDNENIFLEGNIEVGLPIGERQPLSEYSKADHPEKYDEDGNLLPPEEGVITFSFDAGDTLEKVQRFVSSQETVTPYGTAKVSEGCFTPLMSYITLELKVNEESLAAFKEENGEGYYDDKGNLIASYTGLDLFDGWLDRMTLVDGQGNILFPDWHGCNGMSDTWAEITFPYLENIPEEMYLAPVENGAADMTFAIKVK